MAEGVGEPVDQVEHEGDVQRVHDRVVADPAARAASTSPVATAARLVTRRSSSAKAALS
jgi:hypothetical protein